MKRFLLALCCGLLLLVFAVSPVLAFRDYGLIYDGTDKFDAALMTSLSDTALKDVSDRYAIETRVDIVKDSEGYSLDDYAEVFYDKYEYGYGDGDDGILLMLLLAEDGTGLTCKGYSLCFGGDAASLFNEEYRDTLRTALDIYFTPSAWSGDLAADQAICEQGLTAYADVVDNILGSVLEAADTTSAQTAFFVDELGLLDESELNELNEAAARLSEEHGCGIYGMIVADYRDYDSAGVYEAATKIFTDNGFGYGDTADGVFLLLSMDDRDYSLIAHGDKGNAAFTDYGKEKLADEFLDDFAEDDYFAGFSDYLEVSGKYLSLQEAGNPYDVNSGSSGIGSFLIRLAIVIFLPLIFAFLICSTLKKSMKTAIKGTAAADYLMTDSLNFSARDDQFSHITEVIAPIPQSDNSHGGGTTIGGGGFSGHSGKF